MLACVEVHAPPLGHRATAIGIFLPEQRLLSQRDKPSKKQLTPARLLKNGNCVISFAPRSPQNGLLNRSSRFGARTYTQERGSPRLLCFQTHYSSAPFL